MKMDGVPSPFEPPPYPYDRLDEIKAIASLHDGGAIDLSVGVPFDPPPAEISAAMANPDAQRRYPASIGMAEFRVAAADWLSRLVPDVALDSSQVRATIGSKEFVAGLPHLLRLRRPGKDTVLYPAVSYPSYAMGATLAGCRAVPVPVDDHWRIDVNRIEPADIERALCLWVNTPANPTGAIDDLSAVAAWGRTHNVLVVSDECYIEFTWDLPPQSILSAQGSGADPLAGLLAVHSLSKRSNLAGVRVGFYAGDADWLDYLGEVRKHGGFMAPGPSQAGAVVAFGDRSGPEEQRRRYRERLQLMIDLLSDLGVEASMPEGGFYLWVAVPDGDAWGFARQLAEQAGVVVSPGEFYGPTGQSHVRIAVVQPNDRLELARKRLES